MWIPTTGTLCFPCSAGEASVAAETAESLNYFLEDSTAVLQICGAEWSFGSPGISQCQGNSAGPLR